jgi:hypothetical protein
LNLTDYQAKYFAHELTRRFPPDSVEKVTVAFAGAQVDLNPHQIDAALFAFKSPLSRGALLADEVGLGKTIEAGLVLSQKWAERKRRILIITPSNLRKQWYQELTEKFFLPCRLLETKSYNAASKQGSLRPFEAPEIIICSYHFAKNKAEDVHLVPWDLVVIDEAHRLRNVYKPSNVIANTLKIALTGKISILEPFIGQSGWLNAWVHTVESLDQVEDHLILAAITDHERLLDEKTAARLLSLPGDVVGTIPQPQTNGALQTVLQRRQALIQKEISERNARFFEAEADKLDGWADDLKIGLEREIKELYRQIKEARRAATAALTLEEKLAGQKQIKALEAQRNQKRRSLFDAQDEVDRQREALIERIEGKLQQRTELVQLFEIRWRNAAMLAEALCKLEGFTYAPSDAIYWQHGYSTEQDFIYVTTANLTHDQLQQLSDEVGPERSLLVLCTAFRARADRYPNLTVKKIPRAVLARCEWGHDDYSLRVENLPKAPPPKGQMGLFDEDQ